MPKMLASLAVLFALTCTTRLASADDDPDTKSRDTAFALSAGGTALSIGLVAVGMHTGNVSLSTAGVLSSLVTPAAGEIYAGQLLTWGMGIRVASAGVALAGLGEAIHCFAEDSCSNDGALIQALIAAGAIGYASGIIYDLATAGTAVDDYNRRFHLRVTPSMMRTPSAGLAFGVGIGGSF